MPDRYGHPTILEQKQRGKHRNEHGHRLDVHPYQFKRTSTGKPRPKASYRAAKRNHSRVVRAILLSAKRANKAETGS